MMSRIPKSLPLRGAESAIPVSQIRPPGIIWNPAPDLLLVSGLSRSGVICPDSGPPQHAPVVRMT
eukprot:6826079-Karenia_brevis.AAC.1